MLHSPTARFWFLLAMLGLFAAKIASAEDAPAPSAKAVEFFEAKIRPVLVDHCYECHSSKSADVKGGLLLDSRAGLLQGGDSGPAIVAGDPKRSLLMEAIRYGEDSYQMPPKGKLPAEVIADFDTWIQDGAADPRDEKPPAEKSPASKNEHWSFQPVRRAAATARMGQTWPRDVIDAVVWGRLEQRGLKPSGDADRRTLLRRLSYDLTGLPASFEDLESFASDADPLAYEKRVDALLNSPAFGERWARHWLDVARYADTKGYVFMEDRAYAEAYRYRDWVTQSFNGDLPYDQFVRLQIAADRLAPGDAGRLAAMGFLTLGRRFVNNKHDIIDDRIDVVTRGLLGLTVTCARCHDHKYDPIPIEDYYSLYGVFNSSQEPNNDPCRLRLEDVEHPTNVRVFLRGNSRNQGEETPRQFLAALSGENRQPFKDGSGRLELADAIVSPNNPLTARVFVNRVWSHLFGVGLAPTTSDFGLRSDPPIYPEVLDDLAAEFMDDGWSIKRLMRRLVLSSLYRQDSIERAEAAAIDPENRLLWRMNRRRLDFEALRDSLLSVGGGFDRAIGGPSVELSARPGPARRTLYAHIDRQNLPAVFRAFDFANPDTHAPQRFETTTPQQALYLLNNPFMFTQARRVAEAAGESADGSEDSLPSGDDSARRAAAIAIYRRVLSRSPTDEETRAAVDFLAEEYANEASASGRRTLSPAARLAQVLLLSNEFVMVD